MNSQPSPGGRVIGRYEILRRLGQGAMGTVHLARQIDLDRTVALKELDRIGVGESPVLASRFLREARLAGSLSHANIVTVYEYFEHDGRPYIAMEHVEGGPLTGYMDDLTLNQIIGVLEGLLAALTHAEAHDIVHRDIKPENILVSADGRVKIADFGIAKAYTLVGDSQLTTTGTAVGTPMYMAPEQAVAGQPLSIATDLYAVGIVAFEMLFGKVPFGSGENSMAILFQHIHEPVPDVRALRPDLAPAICSWLLGLLEKDASDRPATAVQALDALDEIALELLGNRWRRDARLPARVPTITDVPPAVPSPSRPSPIDGPDRAQTTGAGDATGDVRQPAVVPPAPPERTKHSGWAGRAREPEPEPPPPVTRWWGVKSAALVVAATLVAAAAGYLVFNRDDSVVDPQTATARRFVNDVSGVGKKLVASRRSARERMAAATTARAQASQARAIASAYRIAEADVKRLQPAADQRDAALRLRNELAAARRAYVELAAAGSANRKRAFEQQGAAVDAHDTAVLRAVDRIPGGAEDLGWRRPS